MVFIVEQRDATCITYYILYMHPLLKKIKANKTSTFYKMSNIKFASKLWKQYFLFQWKMTKKTKNIFKKINWLKEIKKNTRFLVYIAEQNYVKRSVSLLLLLPCTECTHHWALYSSVTVKIKAPQGNIYS